MGSEMLEMDNFLKKQTNKTKKHQETTTHTQNPKQTNKKNIQKNKQGIPA